jgi:starch phosphorylase
VGVGLFYTKGYFDQKLRLDGWQEDSDERFDVVNAPLERVYGPSREPFLARVETNGRDVHIGAWLMRVGRVPVYLLDTNLQQNHEDDRDLTAKLYIGGPEVRLKQEWILGVGGVRVLRALGVAPAAWHANEGHAAFMMVERLRELTTRGVPLDDATKEVRARSVFTTHTPVPAGHDTFTFEDLARCSGPVWEQLGVSRETFFDIGTHPTDEPGRFHMTVTALRLVEACERGVATSWRCLAPDLGAALARSRGWSRADQPHHERRAMRRHGWRGRLPSCWTGPSAPTGSSA